LKLLLFAIACVMIASQFGIENINAYRVVLSIILLIAFLGLLMTEKKDG